MQCYQHVLLFCAFSLSLISLGVFAFEKNLVQQSIRVSDTDRTERSVDMAKLRSQSIDAYMTGGEVSLEGTGYSEKELTITAIAIVLMASLVLMCSTYTCSKHLMRDFYRLHKA